MTIDSKYSRMVDLRWGPGTAGVGAADGFEAVVFCFFTVDSRLLNPDFRLLNPEF
jgi:hypothetical protein